MSPYGHSVRNKSSLKVFKIQVLIGKALRNRWIGVEMLYNCRNRLNDSSLESERRTTCSIQEWLTYSDKILHRLKRPSDNIPLHLFLKSNPKKITLPPLCNSNLTLQNRMTHQASFKRCRPHRTR